MKTSGIGIDAIEISRFRSALKSKKNRFIATTFSLGERAYCFSYGDPAPHFAGTFAAKEAVQKALERPTDLRRIEIRRLKNGKPEVWLEGRRSAIIVSITHNKTLACAVALHRK